MTSEDFSKFNPVRRVPTKRRSIGLSRSGVRQPFKSPVPNATPLCKTEARPNISPEPSAAIPNHGIATDIPNARTGNEAVVESIAPSKSTPTVACDKSKTSLKHKTKLTPARNSQFPSTPSSSRKRSSMQRNIFGKKFKMDFKSPVRDPRGNESEEQVRKSLDSLKEKLKSVNEEINTLEESGYNLEEVQSHITKLHEYNELKDLGQHLIGQIASKEGTTTKQIYGRFGLKLDD